MCDVFVMSHLPSNTHLLLSYVRRQFRVCFLKEIHATQLLVGKEKSKDVFGEEEDGVAAFLGKTKKEEKEKTKTPLEGKQLPKKKTLLLLPSIPPARILVVLSGARRRRTDSQYVFSADLKGRSVCLRDGPRHRRRSSRDLKPETPWISVQARREKKAATKMGLGARERVGWGEEERKNFPLFFLSSPPPLSPFPRCVRRPPEGGKWKGQERRDFLPMLVCIISFDGVGRGEEEEGVVTTVRPRLSSVRGRKKNLLVTPRQKRQHSTFP